MFKKLDDASSKLSLTIDGVAVAAEPGDTIASVLLRQEQAWTRETAISGRRRAPYCMMGVCFECLAEVDGVPSVQTCMRPVTDGMCVSRQIGKRKVAL